MTWLLRLRRLVAIAPLLMLGGCSALRLGFLNAAGPVTGATPPFHCRLDRIDFRCRTRATADTDYCVALSALEPEQRLQAPLGVFVTT